MGFAVNLTIFCLVACTIIYQTEGLLGFGDPKRCTWHGTAPFCWPSCPTGKTSKIESKCGPNKIACCITGNKKLCCPAGLDITPEMAAAIATNG